MEDFEICWSGHAFSHVCSVLLLVRLRNNWSVLNWGAQDTGVFDVHRLCVSGPRKLHYPLLERFVSQSLIHGHIIVQSDTTELEHVLEFTIWRSMPLQFQTILKFAKKKKIKFPCYKNFFLPTCFAPAEQNSSMRWAGYSEVSWPKWQPIFRGLAAERTISKESVSTIKMINLI